jgi:MFS family permease
MFPESKVIFVISFGLIWFQLGGWLAIAPYVTSYLFGKEDYSRNYGIMFSAYGFSALTGVYVAGVVSSYTVLFIIFVCLSIFGFVLINLFPKETKSY